MLVMDAPQGAPSQPSAAMSAMVQSPTPRELYGVLGVCVIIENPGRLVEGQPDAEPARLDVRDSAAVIFSYKDKSLQGGMPEKKAHPERFLGDDQYFGSDEIHHAEIKLVKGPKHGSLRFKVSAFQEVYFSPDPGYVGSDKAVFVVAMGGYNIKMNYHLKIIKPGSGQGKNYCPVTEWLVL